MQNKANRIIVVHAQKIANAGTGNTLSFTVDLTDYPPDQYMVISQNVYCSSHEPHSTAVPEITPRLGEKSTVTCYVLGGTSSYANYYVLHVFLLKR